MSGSGEMEADAMIRRRRGLIYCPATYTLSHTHTHRDRARDSAALWVSST